MAFSRIKGEEAQDLNGISFSTELIFGAILVIGCLLGASFYVSRDK